MLQLQKHIKWYFVELTRKRDSLTFISFIFITLHITLITLP